MSVHRGLDLWPSLYADSVCDDSAAKASYPANCGAILVNVIVTFLLFLCVLCSTKLLEALDDDSDARRQRLANRFEEILPEIEEDLAKC